MLKYEYWAKIVFMGAPTTVPRRPQFYSSEDRGKIRVCSSLALNPQQFSMVRGERSFSQHLSFMAGDPTPFHSYFATWLLQAYFLSHAAKLAVLGRMALLCACVSYQTPWTKTAYPPYQGENVVLLNDLSHIHHQIHGRNSIFSCKPTK